MDCSTTALLSEEELVEIAGRMLAGEYKNIKGFAQDLAAFLLTTEKTALSRDNNNNGEIIYVSEIHRIESIITGEAWRTASGLRAGEWH
ncbi:MAG TPA: hypothetical protein DCM44_02575 [Pantoea sp.]|jgi:hypothetical protein|uniref:hypothetical protein n=1 Tax=Pantoea TaxID=53335 RepID=UPI000660CB29|nr:MULTISPECIES: hypothetical protein [Pantoea]MBS6437180.1 hypothetical protein [Pantoea sp.]MDU1574863.1 hypothetical protein [Pantoea sp.]MDU2731172.1 hypothetical protein [Pantoea sp.]MDU6079229.1 hypothetical protein [Pantoea sp.]PNK62518.1 hypothetical protein A6J33_006880 [Pantoea sp. FDAARGOS_194]